MEQHRGPEIGQGSYCHRRCRRRPGLPERLRVRGPPLVRGLLVREGLSWGKGRPGPDPWLGRGVLAETRAGREPGEPSGVWGCRAAVSNRLFRGKPGAGAGSGFAGGRAARGGPAGEHAPARPGPAPRLPPARRGASVPGLARARPPAEPGHRRPPGHGTGREH